MNIRLLVLSGLLGLTAISCKKDNKDTVAHAAIRVVHAISGLPEIKVNPMGPNIYYKNLPLLKFGTSVFTHGNAGSSTIKVVSAADSNKVVFNGTYQLIPAVYTMYLSGTAAKVDTLFRLEQKFPYIKTDRTPASADSVVHLRFVNLSAGSPPLKINLKTVQNVPANPNIVNTPSIAPPANLPYQGISEWSKYPAKAVNGSIYTFEARNAITNEVLIAAFSITLTPSVNYFKSVSLIIKGAVGGTGSDAIGVFECNYF